MENTALHDARRDTNESSANAASMRSKTNTGMVGVEVVRVRIRGRRVRPKTGWMETRRRDMKRVGFITEETCDGQYDGENEY